MALDTYSSEFHVSFVRDNAILLDRYSPKHIALYGYGERERKPALEAPRVVECQCEKNSACVAYLRWREFGEPLMDSETWATTARGLSQYHSFGSQWLDAEESPEARAVRTYFAFLNRVRRVEEDCPAKLHYPKTLEEAWHGKDTFTSYDEEKVREDAQRWEYEQFLVGRSHGLIGQPAEEDHGFQTDRRRAANEETLEREYGETKVEEREVVTGVDKGWMNAPVYEKREVEVVSEVEKEYRRRRATIERGQRRGEDLGVVAGPWMNSRTYRYLLERQRRDNLVTLMRGSIAKELRARALDPKDEKVAARVRQIVAERTRVRKGHSSFVRPEPDTLDGYQAALQAIRRLPVAQ